MKYRQIIPTPLGTLIIDASALGLTHVWFSDMANIEIPIVENPSTITHRAAEQLTAYFSGSLVTFDVPLAPVGTDFQQRVWAQLQTLAFGQTCSYGDIAERLGQPTASRAVGMANSKNPLGIIVPCHRVIGKNKHLTGYAGGLDKKAWLLAHENGEFRLAN